jgi:hypothetical protein
MFAVRETSVELDPQWATLSDLPKAKCTRKTRCFFGSIIDRVVYGIMPGVKLIPEILFSAPRDDVAE